MPLRAVFEAPTVRRLAARVDAGAGGEAPLPPVAPTDRSGALPLSFAQERMWFLERLEPAAGLYNMPLRIRLRGPLDAEALRRALELVVHRHEALRTVVREEGDAPVQRVLPPARFDLPVLAPRDAADARRVLDEAAWAPIDLANGPAMRAVLVRAGGDEHVLALTIHHAHADGWSLGIVFREASAAYDAFAAGREPRLPPVELQYGDFCAWQRAHLSGDRLIAQADWWRTRLADAPPLLELPTDRPRPPRQSHRGDVLPVHLPAELVRRLKAVAATEGATLFMSLLAGFQALLGRLSGQDDVVVGTPVAGRGRAETETIVGMFVNTLALRAGLADDPAFRALLGRVRESTLGAFAHQELPFERLVQLLRVERSPGHAPVFQVMFSLQNQETGTLRLPGIASAWDDEVRGAARFDLSVTLEETADGGIEGTAEYAADLFDRGTVARLVERYRRLLEGAAADPGRRLSRVELLGPGERAALLAAAAGAERAWPFIPVHRAVEARAARTPHAAAVEAADAAWTLAELNARADRLAAELRARGAGRGTLAAVFLPRSAALPAALLGVLKAGAACVPIDPTYPDARVRWMLEDSGAAVVLTTRALAAALPATGAAVLLVDEGDAGAPPAAPPSASAEVDGDELAYLVYTSGSTGRPKGAAIPHRALANHMAWMREAFPLDAGDRVLQKTPVSFDASVWEFWAPLLAGATLVMAGPDAHRDPAALAGETAGRGITVLQVVPTLLRALLDEPAFARARTLRRLFAGGEALPGELARRAAAALPGVEVVNLYGPAEACIDATAHRFAGEEGTVPLGHPIANLRAYVLDARLHPALPGAAGELWLAGEGLGRGYHGRPGLTAERWLPEPFPGRAGARMYRTGDRVRRRAGGALEYLGRADEQVKVRGVRVEPGEVEAALAALPGVREAAVAVRGGALVAYVAGGAPPAAELLALLRAHLPDAAVPTRYVALAELPRTPGGKLDRRALPDPGAPPEAAGEAPRTPTEQVLAGIWGEVLGVAGVGRHDGFFALGGHSLLATRVVSRIRAALGVETPLRELFDAPTLEALAARVDEGRARAGGVPDDPIVPQPRDRPLPLSAAQERLWLVQRLAPASTAFNMPMSLWLRGALDVDALRRALAEIVRRHEPLRTVFARGDGGPVQVIRPAGALELPVTDLAPRADAAEALARMMDERARLPFDLERGPLLRLHLVRTAPDAHCLLVDMHHVVSDGWSMERFHAELAALYAAFARGEPTPLPELPVQYADFAAWQRGWRGSEAMRLQAAFWRARLAGAPPLELPFDRPRPGGAALRGAHHEFVVAREVGERVEAVGREAGATPFMALLAVFCMALHRWSGERDLVVGTVVAGRPRAELEAMIGFFANPLALRVDVGGDPSFRGLLARVRAVTLEAYAHQDLPFDQVTEAVGAERVLGRHPVTPVSFGVRDEPPPPPPAAGVAMEPGEGGDAGAARMDLTAGVARTPDGLRCSMEYAADLFDAETIARHGARFAALLAAAGAAPDAPMSALFAAVDADETARVLGEWTRTARPHPAGPIHRLVAAQAARTPGAPALRHAGRETTYAELDAAANRLAHALRARGVGPESLVGVVAGPGTGPAVAILAVLKAGGAFVPLDPAHPAQRLRHILGNAGVRVAVAASAGAAAGVPLEGIELVDLEGEADALAREPSHDPGVAVDPDMVAYVIYTSGSTGRPKGVLVTHRGIPNLVAGFGRRHGIGPESRMLQFASLGFDAAVAEMFPSLAAGATVVLAARDELLAGAPLLALLARERITHVTLPPSLLAVLPDAALPDLRLLLSAGEALPLAVAERWMGGGRLHNGYGPTEVTVCASEGPFVPGDAEPTLGAPFDNVRLYVLDEAMRPVAVGAPGELYVASPGLARGYRRDPAATAAAFVPDPFGGEAGGRLYRTGDRVRWTSDGRLRFVGRVDDQVKVRGVRVEPGEVAALLRAEAAVADAAVVAHGDGAARRLVAYVVPRPGHHPEPAALRAALEPRLPAAMLPAAFVRMAALPLTPNGKLDRARLPLPEAAAAPAAPAGGEQSALERAVAGAWAEVLGVERVGVNESFFEIGGNSLLLARLQERLEDALGREVALVDLFRHPTVRTLAAQIGAPAQPDAAASAASPGAGDVPAEGARRGEDRGAARRAAFARRR
ncbi:MAG TPA: amino acid adenylation domain-containing protein [Longimicrobium sp.]|nr:amino acid adenylation domain-containing protein [Longimicrobium sp.]